MHCSLFQIEGDSTSLQSGMEIPADPLFRKAPDSEGQQVPVGMKSIRKICQS